LPLADWARRKRICVPSLCPLALTAPPSLSAAPFWRVGVALRVRVAWWRLLSRAHRLADGTEFFSDSSPRFCCRRRTGIHRPKSWPPFGEFGGRCDTGLPPSSGWLFEVSICCSYGSWVAAVTRFLGPGGSADRVARAVWYFCPFLWEVLVGYHSLSRPRGCVCAGAAQRGDKQIWCVRALPLPHCRSRSSALR